MSLNTCPKNLSSCLFPTWFIFFFIELDSSDEAIKHNLEDLLKSSNSSSPELLRRALKKIRPDSPDVTRAAKRFERAKKNLVKINEVDEKSEVGGVEELSPPPQAIAQSTLSSSPVKRYICEVHRCRKSEGGSTAKRQSPNCSPTKTVKSDEVKEAISEEQGGACHVGEGQLADQRLGAISKTPKRLA